MLTINKDMTIGKILDLYPELSDIFTQYGMHCISCPCARGESVAEACEVHGIEVDPLINALNEAIA